MPCSMPWYFKNCDVQIQYTDVLQMLQTRARLGHRLMRRTKNRCLRLELQLLYATDMIAVVMSD